MSSAYTHLHIPVAQVSMGLLPRKIAQEDISAYVHWMAKLRFMQMVDGPQNLHERRCHRIVMMSISGPGDGGRMRSWPALGRCERCGRTMHQGKRGMPLCTRISNTLPNAHSIQAAMSASIASPHPVGHGGLGGGGVMENLHNLRKQ